MVFVFRAMGHIYAHENTGFLLVKKNKGESNLVNTALKKHQLTGFKKSEPQVSNVWPLGHLWNVVSAKNSI